MINSTMEIDGYLETVKKSSTRFVNRYGRDNKLSVLIAEEIKRAYEQPLKLEILSSLYLDDYKESSDKGHNFLASVYKKAYIRCRTLECEFYGDMEPIFLDGPGWLPYAERDKHGKAHVSY